MSIRNVYFDLNSKKLSCRKLGTNAFIQQIGFLWFKQQDRREETFLLVVKTPVHYTSNDPLLIISQNSVSTIKVGGYKHSEIHTLILGQDAVLCISLERTR